MRPVGSAAELERRRRRAAELLGKGEKASTIARFLGIHKGSVSKWKKALRQGGPEALAAKPKISSPGLNDQQMIRLEKALQKGSVAHGWANDLWTGERVRIVIQRLFGITYTADHVRRLLRTRLRWTSQKPERRGRERNEEEIERWRTEEFPRIKKTPAAARRTSRSSTNRGS